MILDEFKSIITVVKGYEANDLINKYIEKFISSDTEYYRKNIMSLHTFSDGLWY